MTPRRLHHRPRRYPTGHSTQRPARRPSELLVRALAGALLVLPGACGGNGGQAPDGSVQPPDPPCAIAADDDGDCIANGTEGCVLEPPADRDSDGLRNHQDPDADGDGIPDRTEVGADCALPRDSDGDSLADYLDEDTDNDGVPDRYEDRDGDGRVGTCSKACAGPAECDLAAGEHCSVAIDQSAGTCVSLACMDGESDPRSKDTDGDGTPDATEGTFICNPRDPANPFGLAAVGYADARSTRYPGADWRIAFELGAAHGEVVIDAPAAFESAYVVDLEEQVFGFLVTRPAPDAAGPSAAGVAADAARLLAEAPAIAGVITRSSGVPAQAPGGFDAVIRTTLVATVTAPTTASAVRAAAIAALLGRAPGSVTVPAPMPGEDTETAFAITYQTVQRGEGEKAQSLFLGAVAPLRIYDDPARGAALRADDLSNGSALAVSGAEEATECLYLRATAARPVDMLWVVDEVDGTEATRARLSDLADRILARARASGLDVRMGVTDMRSLVIGGETGRFASRATGGTGDRWLTPADAGDFAGSLRDPSGPDQAGDDHLGLTQAGAAIARHLPRSDDDAQRIRTGAALVVVYVSGEKPQEIEQQTTLGDGNRRPSEVQQAQIATVVAPYLAALVEQNAHAYLIAEPLPFDTPGCAGAREHAYGYYRLVEATGGLVGSMCQDDLGPTVDLMMDAIAARVSPLVLPHRPISASLAVTRDDVLVPRSRAAGWSYGAGTDTVVLLGQPSEPAGPGDVVVAYRRWILPQ